MKEKLIIFDLWNTLLPVAFNMPSIHKKLGLKIGLAEFKRKAIEIVCLSPFNSRKKLITALVKRFKKNPSKQLIQELLDDWMKAEKAAKPFSEVKKVLANLKKKHFLALISNTTCFGKEIFLREGLEKFFDFTLFSFETKLLKPDSEVFKLALNHFNLEPGQVAMVGDSIECDVLPAKKLGMKGILIDRTGKKQSPEVDLIIKALNELKAFK